MKQEDDYIRSFGALTLDHRFKRLMNRLLEEAAAVYEEFGIPFRRRWQSTFTLIAREGPLGVTEIATRVRLTHPAIIQITDGLLKARLIRAGKDRQGTAAASLPWWSSCPATSSRAERSSTRCTTA